jgi:hypothetical protein
LMTKTPRTTAKWPCPHRFSVSLWWTICLRTCPGEEACHKPAQSKRLLHATWVGEDLRQGRYLTNSLSPTRNHRSGMRKRYYRHWKTTQRITLHVLQPATRVGSIKRMSCWKCLDRGETKWSQEYDRQWARKSDDHNIFTGTRLLKLVLLPRGQKCNKEDFTNERLEGISEEHNHGPGRRITRTRGIHMDNSRVHNALETAGK